MLPKPSEASALLCAPPAGTARLRVRPPRLRRGRWPEDLDSALAAGGVEPRIIAVLRQASEPGQATLFSRLEEVIGASELRPGHFQLLLSPGPTG